MHIFLTGEIQIGKSTIIRKVLSELKIKPGGFLTYFGADRAQAERMLHICGAWEQKAFGEAHGIVEFHHQESKEVNTLKINTYGTALIQGSRQWAPLIVMDECGPLEGNAEIFQEEILSCLDDSIPVLGVIKKLNVPAWVDKIKRHHSVKMIEVNNDNRDELPSEILNHMCKCIQYSSKLS